MLTVDRLLRICFTNPRACSAAVQGLSPERAGWTYLSLFSAEGEFRCVLPVEVRAEMNTLCSFLVVFGGSDGLKLDRYQFTASNVDGCVRADDGGGSDFSASQTLQLDDGDDHACAPSRWMPQRLLRWSHWARELSFLSPPPPPPPLLVGGSSNGESSNLVLALADGPNQIVAAVYDDAAARAIGEPEAVATDQLEFELDLDLPGVQCCVAESPRPEDLLRTVEAGKEADDDGHSARTVELPPVGQLLMKHLSLRLLLGPQALDLKTSVGTLMVQDCDPASPFPLMLSPTTSVDESGGDDGDSRHGAWLLQEQSQPLLSARLRLLPHVTAVVADELTLQVSQNVELCVSFAFVQNLMRKIDAVLAIVLGCDACSLGHASARPKIEPHWLFPQPLHRPTRDVPRQNSLSLESQRSTNDCRSPAVHPLVHIRSLSMPKFQIALKLKFGRGQVEPSPAERSLGRGAAETAPPGAHEEAESTADGDGDHTSGPGSSSGFLGGLHDQEASESPSPDTHIHQARAVLDLAEGTHTQASALQQARMLIQAAEADRNGREGYEHPRAHAGPMWVAFMLSMRAIISRSSTPPSPLAVAAVGDGIQLTIGPVRIVSEDLDLPVAAEVRQRMCDTIALGLPGELSAEKTRNRSSSTGSGGAQRGAAALSSLATAAARSGADAVGDLMHLTSKEVGGTDKFCQR